MFSYIVQQTEITFVFKGQWILQHNFSISIVILLSIRFGIQRIPTHLQRKDKKKLNKKQGCEKRNQSIVIFKAGRVSKLASGERISM